MEPIALSVASLTSLLDQEFVLADHQDVALTLVEVDDRSTDTAEAFSVLIEGPADPQLEQGTWTLQHDTGLLELFLVPIGPLEGIVMGYESIVNRTKSS